MGIIDTHIHIGQKSFCNSNKDFFKYDLCNSYENTILLMNQHNVDKAVVLPIPYCEFNSRMSNDYILEAYYKYPDRFIPFCRIDENLEENLFKNLFKGIKLHLLYEQREIKTIKKELQMIEDADVPLLLHAKYKDKVSQVKEILKYAPNLKIILAHMGRGHLYTGEQVVENCIGLKNCSNVFFDTSTVGDVKTIVKSCEIVGYDRILYGSDYPFGKQYFKEDYKYEEDINKLKMTFTKEQYNRIMVQNACKLFRIENESYVRIRRVKKHDLESIVDIINQLSEQDKKYLALKSKYSLIRQIIRSERHCYLAEKDGKVVGFLRESGRPQNYSLLEELFVAPEYRQQGIGEILLDYYHNIFSRNLAKTNVSNLAMIHMLEKKGYIVENPASGRIVNWIRDGE